MTGALPVPHWPVVFTIEQTVISHHSDHHHHCHPKAPGTQPLRQSRATYRESHSPNPERRTAKEPCCVWVGGGLSVDSAVMLCLRCAWSHARGHFLERRYHCLRWLCRPMTLAGLFQAQWGIQRRAERCALPERPSAACSASSTPPAHSIGRRRYGWPPSHTQGFGDWATGLAAISLPSGCWTGRR